MHRHVGVRHGRGPRAWCTNQVELVYISTKRSTYAYSSNIPFFHTFPPRPLRLLLKTS